MTRHQVLTGALLGFACVCLVPAHNQAETPLSSLRLSPDVSIALGGVLVDDHGIVLVEAGAVSLSSIGAIPPQADLDAYHLLPDNSQLLSFDTTVMLPGGVVAEPGDVVRFDGVFYAVLFDAFSAGLTAGVDVDAVSVFGNQLLLSFDVSVNLNGLAVDDEDLVSYDGTAFGMFFDGSAASVGPDVDLDAAQLLECNGHLLLSFDGSGVVGGLPFDDEDLLEYDGAGTWEMALDAAWRGADLDALHATADTGPGPALVFGQEISVDTNIHWPNPVAWKGVRGAFASPADIGTYVVAATYSGFGTVLSDPSVPPPGTGYWYLVKLGGCELTSWQATLGAEPGRDAALP